MVLVGENGESNFIVLRDENKFFFIRGLMNEFFILIFENFGKLFYFMVWYDLLGINFFWYFSYVIICENKIRE